MFTKSTKNFGIWRSQHPTHFRFKPQYSRYILMSMATTTLISWIIVFINENINSRFFLHNQALTGFHKVESALLRPPTLTSLELSIRKTKNGHEIEFDGMNKFLWPQQQKNVEHHLKDVSDRLEFLSLLTGETRESIGKVTVWIDKSADFEASWDFLSALATVGFDTFELPMGWHRSKGHKIEPH